MPKLLDYVLEGGIKDKFFIYHRYSYMENKFMIYQVTGAVGERFSENLLVDICMYDLRDHVGLHNTVEKLKQKIGILLENEEATQEEINLIPNDLRLQSDSI